MRLCTVKSFPWGVLCTFYLVKSSHASSKISSLAGIKLTRVSLSFNGEHQSETSQVPANLFVLIEICAKCYGSRLKGGPATCLSRSCQRLMKWKCLLVYLQSWSDHKRFQCFQYWLSFQNLGWCLLSYNTHGARPGLKQKIILSSLHTSYLSFFTPVKFLENKIYTKKRVNYD